MDYIIYNIQTGEHFGNTKTIEDGQKIVDEYNKKTNRVGELSVENEDDLVSINGRWHLHFSDSPPRN